MNKNLKKVISAVAALAVSASSMVAFAAGYPDVPETASYAQAVTELSALGVVNGYEDGTFAPDKNVSRAEITKMIVTALGSATLSAAEAATGKDTQFNDVPGTHWASGHVTVATSQGSKFINGYSATEFGPEDNVTYVQAIKMLVAALGYTTYAEQNGGWPNGYLQYGYTLDITKGITGVANDTQLTRAQVAQMIDNAVKAPICVIDGYDTQWNGTQTPKLVEKNETSTYMKNTWQCLLNYSHDAYIVNGRVKATHKSESAVETDKVRISIEKSNNFDGLQVANGVNAVASELAYIGDSEADKYLLTYAEMIVQMNDDDELTILSIVPAGANKTATFAAEDFEPAKTDLTTSATRGTIYAYAEGSQTKTDSYKLDTAAITVGTAGGFYVNGVQITNKTLADCLTDFVSTNETGTVTLIDSPAVGTSSTDGIYDYVMVTCYVDAVVDSVDVETEDEVTIYFDDAQGGYQNEALSMLVVDKTDEDMYYSFTTVDGTVVDPAELTENTVLSIAYSPNAYFDTANSYDIIVSTDTVEGKVTQVGGDAAEGYEYTINGEIYKRAGNFVKALETGSEYTLYLDAFGKYAKMEETAASKKIAILDNVYEANGGQYYATLITPDGNKTNYTIKDQATATTYKNLCYTGATSLSDNDKTKLKPVKDRVFEYRVSTSTNNITIGDKVAAKDGSGIYKASSNKIGSVRMNDAITSMLDMSEYYTSFNATTHTGVYDGTVDAMTTEGLEDDMSYVAYGFNKISDNSYQLVLVMNATGTYNYNTEFAVFSSQSTQEVDGENRDVITVYKAGNAEPKDIVLDCAVPSNLAEGDPVVVKTNSAGEATVVTQLFAADVADGYASFATKALAAIAADIPAAAATASPAAEVTSILNVDGLNTTLAHSTPGTSNNSEWKFGIVAAEDGGTMSLVTKFDTIANPDKTVSAYTSNLEGVNVEELDYDADVKFITYNYKERAGRQLRVSASTSKASVVVRNLPNNAYFGTTDGATPPVQLVDADEEQYVDWNVLVTGTNAPNAQYGMLTFALVKTVDNNVTEVYSIVPSSSKN